MATMNGATNMIVFEDLSGSTVQTLEGENPYQGLITDSNNDPVGNKFSSPITLASYRELRLFLFFSTIENSAAAV